MVPSTQSLLALRKGEMPMCGISMRCGGDVCGEGSGWVALQKNVGKEQGLPSQGATVFS